MFTNAPRVTVLMSVYNGEGHLREAIESILNQTFGDFEFVIVDDGSTDNTAAILDSYADARIVRVHNEANIGLTKSLNKGLGLARGEYIARQDADDVSLLERLDKQVMYLDKHPSVGLVGTTYDIISCEGRLLQVADVPTENSILQQKLLESNCFCHGSVMFRRICLHHVGGYRTFCGPAEDYDLWLRIAEHFELANLPDRLYQYRFNPESISLHQTELQMAYLKLVQDLARMRRLYGHEHISLDEDCPVLLDNIPKPEPHALAQRFFWNVNLFYLSGDEESARASLVRAIATDPSLADYKSCVFDWLLGHAQAIAREKQSFEAGSRFILTMLSDPRGLPKRSHKLLRKKVLGEFFVAAAFESYAQAELGLVRRHLATALCNDQKWLLNKGVLSIGLDSVIGRRLAKLRRRIFGREHA